MLSIKINTPLKLNYFSNYFNIYKIYGLVKFLTYYYIISLSETLSIGWNLSAYMFYRRSQIAETISLYSVNLEMLKYHVNSIIFGFTSLLVFILGYIVTINLNFKQYKLIYYNFKLFYVKDFNNWVLEVYLFLLSLLGIVLLVIPSIKFLYFSNWNCYNCLDAESSVKVASEQWFWGYGVTEVQ